MSWKKLALFTLSLTSVVFLGCAGRRSRSDGGCSSESCSSGNCGAPTIYGSTFATDSQVPPFVQSPESVPSAAPTTTPGFPFSTAPGSGSRYPASGTAGSGTAGSGTAGSGTR